MNDAPSGPTTRPFSYVLIPADDQQPPQLQRYEGNSDEELKKTLRSFFARYGGGLNEDQKKELQGSLRARLDETKKKNEAKEQQQQQKVQVVDDDDDSSIEKNGTKKAENSQLTADLLEHAVNGQEPGSFEIVPVTMPGLKNKFIGTSLYIDSTGMFKDLPQNARASRLVGREVRGAAFLLANHDDPALESWERVDTTLEDYERLYGSPPDQQQRPALDSPGGNAAAIAEREDYTRVVSAEDAAAALQRLADGRAGFGAQKFDEALEHFAQCYALLKARTDLLPNSNELQQAKTLAVLNGAACALKLSRWGEAESLAQAALNRDPNSEKAAYRLCSAKLKLRDFQGARRLIQGAKEKLAKQSAGDNSTNVNPVVAAWRELEEECNSAQAAFEKQERAKYSKMFG